MMNLTLPAFVPFGQPCTQTAEERRAAQEKRSLLREIRQCVAALNTEHENYSELTDPDLIDAHIYHVLSLEAQYRFLLRRARDMGLSAETPEALLK